MFRLYHIQLLDTLEGSVALGTEFDVCKKHANRRVTESRAAFSVAVIKMLTVSYLVAVKEEI